MEFTIHLQILAIVFVTGIVMGAVANKTNFCTMGAVSDWVNMGDTGKLSPGTKGHFQAAPARLRRPKDPARIRQ
jgi:hypothetical protein